LGGELCDDGRWPEFGARLGAHVERSGLGEKLPVQRVEALRGRAKEVGKD
jgi:hypothetical protein